MADKKSPTELANDVVSDRPRCPTCKGDMPERRKNRWANQETRQARKKEPIDPAVREADAKKLVSFLIGHPCKHRGEGHNVVEIDCSMCLRAAILAFAAKWADGRGVADVVRLHAAEAMAGPAIVEWEKHGQVNQYHALCRFLMTKPDEVFLKEVKQTVEDSADILKGLESAPAPEPEPTKTYKFEFRGFRPGAVGAKYIHKETVQAGSFEEAVEKLEEKFTHIRLCKVVEGLETCQLHGLEFSPSHNDWEMCPRGCTRGIPS